MRLGIVLTVTTLGGCLFGSTDPETRPPPEICGDEIDNDLDGLVDCDDVLACGGAACETTTYITDTQANLPNADILFSGADCCDFEFGPDSCPSMVIGTIDFLNRATETDGEFDINCDLVESVSPIQWQVEGATEPIPFVVNQSLFADDTLTVTGVFVCQPGLSNTIVTTCRANLDVGADHDAIEFEVTGTPLQ